MTLGRKTLVSCCIGSQTLSIEHLQLQKGAADQQAYALIHWTMVLVAAGGRRAGVMLELMQAMKMGALPGSPCNCLPDRHLLSMQSVAL